MPQFIVLFLISLKIPLQCLHMLSVSKNNYCFNEYKCHFASKRSVEVWIGNFQW